jgi:superfamily II DNA or RNA helicase
VHTAATPPPGGLREWQATALEAWLTAGRRGIVEVATGGGKTRFALACAAALSHETPTIQVVVPTTALADQWFVSITEETDASASEVAFLNSRAGAPDLKRFNITVINSARALDPQIWQEASRFLIVDECHRAASSENSKALAGNAIASLGLSATPDRQYDDGLTEILVPALGPVIYRYGLREASRDRILNNFTLTNVRVPLTDEEQHDFTQATRRVAKAMSRGQEDETYLALLRARARIATNAVARLPTAVSLAERHRGARTLVFHETIGGAEAILAMLKARGHSAAVYHSHLGPHLRRENLRLFRRGVFDILVTCRALDEGVNIPEVEVAIIAAATASDRQRVQRLGRVLRPAPGKPTAQVYTVYATDQEEARLRQESTSLDGVAETNWLRAEVA